MCVWEGGVVGRGQEEDFTRGEVVASEGMPWGMRTLTKAMLSPSPSTIDTYVFDLL